MIVLLGFSPDLESTLENVGSESGKGKTTHLGVSDMKLLVAGAGLSSCSHRFEVGVAACVLIEAHSYTLSSFKEESSGTGTVLVVRCLDS